MNLFKINKYKSERGMALPLSLFLALTVLLLSGIYSSLIKNSSDIVKSQEHSKALFYLAEGAVHNFLGELSVNAHLWLEQPSIADLPQGYTSFNPYDFQANNGIPSCSGVGCLRNLFPEGGGLVKNFGPILTDGASVASGRKVTKQLNTASLPDPDVNLNSQEAWTQLERLDETELGKSSIGTDISNNPSNSSGSNPVRFRLTGKALKDLKTQSGQSTVVVIVEVPPA